MVRDGHNSASVVRSAPWLHCLIWKKRLPTWSSLHWGYIVPPAGVSSTYLAYNGHPKPTRLDLCPFRKYTITSYAPNFRRRRPPYKMSASWKARQSVRPADDLTRNFVNTSHYLHVFPNVTLHWQSVTLAVSPSREHNSYRPFAQLLPGLETGHPVTVGQSPAHESHTEQFETETRKTAFCWSETLKSYAGDWPTVAGCPVSNPGNNCANGLLRGTFQLDIRIRLCTVWPVLTEKKAGFEEWPEHKNCKEYQTDDVMKLSLILSKEDVWKPAALAACLPRINGACANTSPFTQFCHPVQPFCR